jgi:hypothetical protein
MEFGVWSVELDLSVILILKLKGHGSWVMGHGSWVKGHGSKVIGLRFKV